MQGMLTVDIYSYIVLNIPWMVGTTVLTASNTPARRWREVVGSAFFAALVPLVYWYIQHKVHRRAGGEFDFLRRRQVLTLVP